MDKTDAKNNLTAVGRFDYVVPEVTRDYYRFVMVTLPEVPAGMYGMDQRRAELHAAMCIAYGLTSEVTKTVTDNMDKIEYGAEGLHRALQDLRESFTPNMAKETDAECFGRLLKDAKKNADPALWNIVLDNQDNETWELKACDKCLQLTNHDKDGCLKCRAKERHEES